MRSRGKTSRRRRCCFSCEYLLWKVSSLPEYTTLYVQIVIWFDRKKKKKNTPRALHSEAPDFVRQERVTGGSFSGSGERRWALSLHPPPPRSALNERCLKKRENACLLICSLANLLAPSAEERLKKYRIIIQICTVFTTPSPSVQSCLWCAWRWGRRVGRGGEGRHFWKQKGGVFTLPQLH